MTQYLSIAECMTLLKILHRSHKCLYNLFLLFALNFHPVQLDGNAVGNLLWQHSNVWHVKLLVSCEHITRDVF